jgi:L-amino acid N-acyltransferase YncA
MITVQVEKFADAADELAGIFPCHWEELGLFRERMPLAPQLSEYARRDQHGELVLVTVRRSGRVVAYYTAHVRPGFHYGTTLTGTMDMMFVVPTERGRGLCGPLMRKVERELSRRGVQIWYSGWKTNKPQGMDRLHALLGFTAADTYQAKWIGGRSR